MKPLVFCLVAALFARYTVYAQSAGSPAGEVPDVARLLAGFLENDISLKELAIKAQQAELGRRQTGIANGFDLSLSTGAMSFYSENGAAAFSVTPRAELSFPQFNSTKLGLAVPMRVNADEDGAYAGGVNEGGLTVENAQLTLSTTLIGSAGKQRTVTLLRSDRAVLEARRALARRGRTAEKEFYERLRSLYESTVQVLTLENTAYTKEIDMALAQAQGYAPSSVQYRTVELEAADAHRAAQEQRRKLQRGIGLFARDCGLTALADLPQLIPQADLEAGPEFGQAGDRERFTEVEAAQWAQYIGGLSRSAGGQVELSAEGGLTANNTRVDGSMSADAGLTLGWRGLSLSAGTQVPISGGGSPAFTLSLGLNTGKQRLGALSGEEKALAAESEALALMTAERNWDDTVDSVRTERADLVWEQKRLLEQYGLYRELAADTAVQYQNGMVTESEYRKAITNEERAKYQILAADVQNMIHLINTALYFVEE
jgi:hypothetical protein